jgi:hypothetical protein
VYLLKCSFFNKLVFVTQYNFFSNFILKGTAPLCDLQLQYLAPLDVNIRTYCPLELVEVSQGSLCLLPPRGRSKG